MFASASGAPQNGQIIFWTALASGMIHKIENAHTAWIWGMAWHPSG